MRERDRMIQILFLEDEPTIREVLAEYMKIQGYEVTEAGDVMRLKQNMLPKPGIRYGGTRYYGTGKERA